MQRETGTQETSHSFKLKDMFLLSKCPRCVFYLLCATVTLLPRVHQAVATVRAHSDEFWGPGQAAGLGALQELSQLGQATVTEEHREVLSPRPAEEHTHSGFSDLQESAAWISLNLSLSAYSLLIKFNFIQVKCDMFIRFRFLVSWVFLQQFQRGCWLFVSCEY